MNSPTSPLSNTSDIKNKHFLSRFLSSTSSTSPPPQQHLHTPPTTPPFSHYDHKISTSTAIFDSTTKIKKKKGIGKLFKKLTKSSVEQLHPHQSLTTCQNNIHPEIKENNHNYNHHHNNNNVNTTTIPSLLPTTCSSTSTLDLIEAINMSDHLSIDDDNININDIKQRQRSITVTSNNTQSDSVYSSYAATVITTDTNIINTKKKEDINNNNQLYIHTNHCDNNEHIHINNNNNSNNSKDVNEDNHDEVNEEEEEDDDINESSDDESFVDAAEEINHSSNNNNSDNNTENKRSSLSHLLGAGHFNSAGGLAVNINPTLSAYRNYSSIQKLRRSLPPDELTQSMLDWKRKSTDGNNRFSGIFNVHDNISDPKRSSLTTNHQHEKKNENYDHIDEDEKELSKEDKEASRALAENKLISNTASSSTSTTTSTILEQSNNNNLNLSSSQQRRRPQHERSRSIKALSEMFSKSLDEAWNQSPSKVEQLQDPRLSHVWMRPSHLSVKSKETAKRIWDEDESFITKDRFAEWLGQANSFNAETLVCYMDLFYFANMQLDSAFRKLCSKLYFKAEAQQIDRILEVFAHRYWDCNPQSIFKCADVVYAVVYSILLLNTDLHVVQGNHQRMTKSEFIKNTMVAINTQRIQHLEINYPENFEMEMENYLKEIYISVKNYQILQPLSGSNPNIIVTRSNLRHVESLKRGVNSIIRRAGRESVLIENEFSPIQKLPTTTSLSTQLSSPSATSLTSSTSSPQSLFTTRKQSRSLSIRQSTIGGGGASNNNNNNNNNGTMKLNNDSIASFSSGQSNIDNNNNSNHHNTNGIINMINNNNNDHHPMQRKRARSILRSASTSAYEKPTFIQNPPYAKEGIIMCKHLLKSSDQKARYREWNEYLVVVNQGTIKLYNMPTQSELDRIIGNNATDLLRPINKKTSKKVIESPLTSFNPAWNDYLAVTIELNHTLANVLPPPGYNKNRPHVFALQQANGGVFLFQGISLEDVTSWTVTCNYWAAMKSKEPLQGGVSNMDFGWGDCLVDVIMDLDAIQNGDSTTGNTVGVNSPDAITIYDWQPPVPPMSSSRLSEQDQLKTLKEHLHWLHAEINEHREVKTKILVKFPKKSFNYKKVMANWSLKSSYLLGDILKYQHYCDAIEKGLQHHQRRLSLLSSSSSSILIHDKLDVTIDFDKGNIDLIKEIENELSL
ncbi:unnamed protein product [Cunninghamella blakesleeana]